MIVARAPLRLPLAGGGTDLPGYAARYGGLVVAAAIKRHVHVCVAPRLGPGVRFSHERTEEVAHASELEHALTREALRLVGVEGGLQIASLSELPPGSGLGSSGSFTVALLAALHAHLGAPAGPRQLAEEACHLELEVLGGPGGRQDQFIAAFGGVALMRFGAAGRVELEPAPLAPGALEALEARLVVLHTGVTRRSSVPLGEQGRRIDALDPDALARMHRIREVGDEVRRLLETGELDGYGELLHEHWIAKRKLSSATTDDALDAHYEAARRAGAVGGKLVGAGGGGFFVFYARPEARERLIDAMRARGLSHLALRFEPGGVRVFDERSVLAAR